MSEQSAAPTSPSAGSESSPEAQVTGSTSNSPSESSGSSAPAPTGAQASQIVDAIENADKQSDGTYELIIDGEKVTLTLEEMKAGYQKAKASAKRFQEASEKTKAAEAKEAALEERKKQLLKNPLKAMFEEGVSEADARKHYEEAVWQWLQQDQMTPEQKAEAAAKREFETERQRVAREKEEIENWKREREAERAAAEVEKYQNEYATQLQGALVKHNLPMTPDVAAKLVGYMKDAIAYGEDITFDDAAQMYKEEHTGSLQSYLKGLNPQQLMELLGPEGVKAFRKQDVETNIKNPTSAPKRPEVEKSKSKDSKVSSKDFFASLGRK